MKNSGQIVAPIDASDSEQNATLKFELNLPLDQTDSQGKDWLDSHINCLL